MSTPVSSIVLYKGVPLDNTYRNTFSFKNQAQQRQHFGMYESTLISSYTYLRRGEPIRVEGHIDTFHSFNYLRYNNAQGKDYYCFITNKEYINDRTTAFYIEIDVMQTFQFDYEWLHTFVERSHVDRWGGNLETDNLDLGGEYVIAKSTEVYQVKPQYCVSVTTITMEDGYDVDLAPGVVNGVPNALWYAIMTPEELDNRLGGIAKSPSVVSMVKLPLDVVNLSSRTELGIRCVITPPPGSEDLPTLSRILLPFMTEYTPKKTLGSVNRNGYGFTRNTAKGVPFNPKYEGKFLSYPYTYGLLSDCQATPQIIKHEYAPDVMTIKGVGSVSHSPKAKYYVEGYRGDQQGKFDVVISERDRQLPLTSDNYANYIMNNSTSIRTAQAFNVVGTGLNVATATMGSIVNPVGSGVSVVNSLYQGYQTQKNEMAKQKDLAIMPDSVRNMGNDVAFDIVDDNNKIMYYHMTISDEAIERIGQFWHLYGYPVNRVMIPNTNSRYYYNYIKTIGANIKSGIETEYLNKICEIYNNGITIWHYRDGLITFDYTYDNVEV